MKKALFFFVVITTFSFSMITQTDFKTLIEQQLNNYTYNKYPEKVYIHTDKPFYTLNDDLWFTSYLVNGVTHQQTEKSKIIHVELINPQDSIVASRTLYTSSLSVAGDFKINNKWKPGTYLLRAYTNYMKNHGDESFFQKEIPISNILQNKNIPQENIHTNNNLAPTKTDSITMSFYPEGGYLVNDLINNVALKIKDNNNTSNSFAVLKDENGNEIAKIKILKFGLGNFIFRPQKGTNYHVSYTTNGKEFKYFLPKPLEKGFVLSVRNTPKNISVNVNSTTDEGLKNTFLVAHQRGKLVFKKFQESTKKAYSIAIPSSLITDGVVNITLFNSNGHPVSERSVFVTNPENKLDAKLTTNKTNYGTKEKVTVNLALHNNSNVIEKGVLSMSVRDLKAYPYNYNSSNIKTYLLLNSDLRGTIKDPNYFFEDETDPKRNQLLDLIMMTHGWKKFTWQELLTEQPKELTYPAETGLYISGTLKKLKKPYTLHQGLVKLTFLGNPINQLLPIQADSLGRFQFGPFSFNDTIPTILEARLDHFNSTKRNSRNITINLNNTNTPPNINRKNESTNNINNNLQKENYAKVNEYLKQLSFKYKPNVEKLEVVELNTHMKTAAEKRMEEMNSRTNYGTIGFGGSKRLDVTKLEGIGSFSALELLMRLGNVYYDQEGVYLMRNREPLQLFLDGMEVDYDYLTTIQGEDISFIDLLIGTDASIVTSFAGNGVICLYTKTGVQNQHIERKPGVINFNAIGFYTAREFYAPTPAHTSSAKELNDVDIRTLLHWEPIIKATTNKIAKTSFYTSELNSSYIIEIQGISELGKPIHITKKFNVN